MAKTHTFEPTQNKDLDRVVDRNGDWKNYFYKSSEKFLRSVNNILDEGYAKGIGFQKYLLSVSKEEAEKRLESAGERGDRIHQAIVITLLEGKANRAIKVLAEDGKSETVLLNDEWDSLLSFAEFWNRHEAELILQELSVFNLSTGYAGTLDAIIKLTKNCGVKTCKCDEMIGKVGLVDWKSSGAIYNSYGCQVAAYAKGENLEVKIDYTGIVRLGTRHKTTGGYEFVVYNAEETELNFAGFLAAKFIADKDYKEFTMDDIFDVPDAFELLKPKENKVKEVKPEPKPKKKRGRPKKVSKKNGKNGKNGTNK